MNSDFSARLRELLAVGQDFALVTVVSSQGSTPRKAGTKMLVDGLGRSFGTIGGGCPEAEANGLSVQVAKSGQAQVSRVFMGHTKDEVDASPNGQVLICGGDIEVLMEPMRGATANGEVMERVLASADAGDSPQAVLALWRENEDLPGPGCSYLHAVNEVHRFACWADGRWLGLEQVPEDWRAALRQEVAQWVETAADTPAPALKLWQRGAWRGRLFLEPWPSEMRMVIAGAGHVAVPLCQMAALCGYRVTVVDDRPEFASSERFPAAAQVLCADFEEFFADLAIDAQMAIVLVTRGHRHDELCLRRINGRRPGYLGMIGSKRRNAILRQRLRDDGFDEDWLASINAPIGLSIGAQTPAEIAVAIMAQIIGQRYGCL